MKKFLEFIHWRHLKHLYHTEKKRFPHYQNVAKAFFRTRNGKLAIIFVLAAMIPITVLGVQTVQDIRQHAAGNATCDGSQLLHVTTDGEFKVSTKEAPFPDGADIIFSHTDGKITNDMFENADFTGNGAKSCTYDSANGWIRCKAKYIKDAKTNTQKAYSTHTYTYQGPGIFKCDYYVGSSDANKPPKPTKSVTNTPKVTKPPEQKTPTQGKCEANISAYGCTADNKPRLRTSWNMVDEGKGCSVRINGKEISTECANSSENITQIDGSNLTSGTKYEIVISNNGSCNGGSSGGKQPSATAPSCSGGNNPTTKPGDPTNTPKPGQSSAPDIKDFVCQLTASDKTKALYATWSWDGDKTNGYLFSIYDESDGNKAVVKDSQTHTESGGNGNYTPVENHTYRIEVRANTNPIGDIAKEKVTCSKNGGSGKVGAPADGIKGEYINNNSQLKVSWNTAGTNAAKYIITVTDSKGNQLPQQTVDASSDKTQSVTFDVPEDKRNETYKFTIVSVGADGTTKSQPTDPNGSGRQITPKAPTATPPPAANAAMRASGGCPFTGTIASIFCN